MERNPLLFTITMDFLAIIISQGKEKQWDRRRRLRHIHEEAFKYDGYFSLFTAEIISYQNL
jgi:hypothetical protein